jgi:hypothetical protein
MALPGPFAHARVAHQTWMLAAVAGQDGGPLVGHDGGHGGVDPAFAVLVLLGEPGAPRVLLEYRVADVAGQRSLPVVGQQPVHHGRVEAGGLRPILAGLCGNSPTGIPAVEHLRGALPEAAHGDSVVPAPLIKSSPCPVAPSPRDRAAWRARQGRSPRRPHPYQRSAPRLVSAGSGCDLHQGVPLATVVNRSVPMACGPNVDQAGLHGVRSQAARVRDGQLIGGMTMTVVVRSEP